MPVQVPGAPAAVASALDRLKDDLTRIAGQNLAGVILYGGLSRGRYRPGKSDVNVVVLLQDASGDALAAIAPALRAAARAAAVVPLILTPAEVPQAAAAFPTKFLDIKNHHIVLAGASPFAALEVTREQIRLRAAQALHNLLLRLRHRFVGTGGDADLLAQALARTARPFALELEALLQLAGRALPEDDRSAAVFDAAAAAFGLEREPLTRLAELRQNPVPAGDVTTLYRGVLAAVGRAVDLAEEMKGSPR